MDQGRIKGMVRVSLVAEMGVSKEQCVFMNKTRRCRVKKVQKMERTPKPRVSSKEHGSRSITSSKQLSYTLSVSLSVVESTRLNVECVYIFHYKYDSFYLQFINVFLGMYVYK